MMNLVAFALIFLLHEMTKTAARQTTPYWATNISTSGSLKDTGRLRPFESLDKCAFCKAEARHGQDLQQGLCERSQDSPPPRGHSNPGSKDSSKAMHNKSLFLQWQATRQRCNQSALGIQKGMQPLGVPKSALEIQKGTNPRSLKRCWTRRGTSLAG